LEWTQPGYTLALSLALVACSKSTFDDTAGAISSVEEDGSWACAPENATDLPGVLYNHGGLGDAIGGDLEGTCRALAEAGYVGYAKKRRETESMEGHLDDVYTGLDALQSHPSVNADRIAIIGFSRGGLLTLQAAIERPTSFEGIVVMAPAPGADGQFSSVLDTIDTVQAPFLVLVSENDTVHAEHVDLAESLVEALESAGSSVEYILYPPYGDDGHELFFKVDDYWPDVTAFLSGTFE